MLLMVTSICSPIYIIITLHYPFIEFRRILHLIWLYFTMPLEEKTPDKLSKYWRYTKIYGIFQPLLFWMEDTMELMYLEINKYGGQ